MNDHSTVYDLFYPSPITLREIATIKVVIELWRQEIREHCSNNTLEELNFGMKIPSSKFNTLVPSTIFSTVDMHIEQFGLSIKYWLEYHSHKDFFQLEVLRNFDDFAGDFDGSIHYRRTAEQMISCEEISLDQKFKIACLYCLENDIVQLWSSVSSQFNLNEIRFCIYPQLYYWICRLKNQLYKMPITRHLGEIFEDDFEGNLFTNLNHWPSLEYFFTRVADPRKRMYYVNNVIFPIFPQAFYRYVLVKLTEEEFNQFFIYRRECLWNFLCTDVVLKITRCVRVEEFWMYFKLKMNENDFVKLLQEILKKKPTNLVLSDPLASCKIWESAPDNFKRSAIQHVLLDNLFFRNLIKDVSSEDVSFFLKALSDASLKERLAFWNMHWRNLIELTKFQDFCELMSMCFRNNLEIIQYKKNVMSQYENIGQYCLKIFKAINFEKLNTILRFCCVEEKAARNIRQRLLNEEFTIYAHLEGVDTLNKFINDAFIDVDHATEFKNQLILKPSIRQELQGYITNGFFLESVSVFIDTMISSKHDATDFKKQYVWPIFKRSLMGNAFISNLRDSGYYINFLRWCLENDDKLVECELKQTVSIDEIVQAMIRREIQQLQQHSSLLYDKPVIKYCPELVEFLKWFLISSEAYENFLVKYAGDDVFVKMITPSEPSVE